MAAALAETAHLNADSKLENGSRKRRGINTPAQSRRTGTLVIFDALGQATQRARAVGRMRLVESILEDKDWRGKAWYLERTDPAQFGRSQDRPLPVEKDDNDKQISVAIVCKTEKPLSELLAFPVAPGAEMPTSEMPEPSNSKRPIVGFGGRVIGSKNEQEGTDEIDES
jgi:hypothetical protein